RRNDGNWQRHHIELQYRHPHKPRWKYAASRSDVSVRLHLHVFGGSFTGTCRIHFGKSRDVRHGNWRGNSSFFHGDLQFSGDPTSLQNQVVHITDKFGAETAVELGSLDAAADTLPHTFHPGDRTFSCDTDGGTHTNTAKIVETGQTDTASVTVNCHALTVTKDAATSRRREWEWSIEKSADQSSLQLSANELLQVNYQVTVNAQSTDSLAVTGKITVDNPAPIDAILTGITDSMTSDLTATVSCGSISFPYTLAAGTHLDCTY